MYHKAHIRASANWRYSSALRKITAISGGGPAAGGSAEPAPWARNALRTLLPAFGAPILLAAALNFLVNPLGLYPTHLLAPTEQNLRRYKYEQVRQLGVQPATVILGSSRVMTMRASDVEQYLPGDCYNYSMQSAAAEDWYAALRLLVDDLRAPVKHVVIGMDYEAFNPVIPTMSQARYFDEFSKYLVHTKLRSKVLDQFSLLLSAEQLDATKGVLTNWIEREHKSQNKVVEPDGTLLLRDREQLIAEGKFDLDEVLDKRVRKYASRSLRLDGYAKPSEERLQYLDDLLDFADAHGIKVHIYITPYHPRLWEVLRPLPGISVLRETRRLVQQRCQEHGAYLVDFSRVDRFGGDSVEFYDEIHMRPSNQARLLKALFLQEQQSTEQLALAGAAQ